MRVIRRSVALASILSLLLVPVLHPLASGADPGETISNSSDADQVNLTIYNASISLVHDRRSVTLTAGANNVAWRDVSAQMDATSAVLDDISSPGGVQVIEQNFDFDLLNPSALLDKYVGRDVVVVHNHPLPGQPARESAKLLADNDGVVLQYRNRIETDLNDSHIIYPEIPENLRDRPTLVLQTNATQSGSQDLDLSYLTTGLTWRTDYIGVVSPNEDRMQIQGLVTLNNTSGTTFPNARLQLVAGNVNVVQPPRPTSLMTIARVTSRSMASASNGFTQQDYFEYHLYTLGRPTTIANAQTKQVTLLTAHDVPIRKTLELRGSPYYYGTQSGDLGATLKVGVYIGFTNKDGDLGIPLPAGIFRVYKNDSGGTSQFLGSDSISHTPRDQDVRLHVGDSFDVTAHKRQTNFQHADDCNNSSTYKIALSNAKDQAQDVLVVEPIPGEWRVTDENFPHVKTSSSTATWTISIPARQTTTLTYTAHVKYC